MRWSALVLAIALAGCFPRTYGRPIQFDREKELTPGVSTRTDAEGIFGPPSIVALHNGLTLLTWTHVEVHGTQQPRSELMQLAFDASGCYVRQPYTPPASPPPK